jgi:hypothetical protein
MVYINSKIIFLILFIYLGITLQIYIYEESLTALKILEESSISTQPIEIEPDTQPTEIEPDSSSDDLATLLFIIAVIDMIITI